METYLHPLVKYRNDILVQNSFLALFPVHEHTSWPDGSHLAYNLPCKFPSIVRLEDAGGTEHAEYVDQLGGHLVLRSGRSVAIIVVNILGVLVWELMDTTVLTNVTWLPGTNCPINGR